MRADYRVDELITEEETGEVIAKCFDTFYEEEFEKYLGMPDEWDGKQNASTLLKDSSYFMSDEIRQELMTTFGVEEFDAEEENPGYQFYDFGDDDDIDFEDEEKFAVPTKSVRRESFDLREALNEIDLRTDNRYDLLNLYEACDLSSDEKKKLATVVYDQEDASVIYDTLNDRYITGKEIDIPERVKDGHIHEGLYKDVSGIMGEPNETYSEEDLENYWNTQKDNDPSLRTYSNYNSWLRDTISYMEEVEEVEESKSSTLTEAPDVTLSDDDMFDPSSISLKGLAKKAVDKEKAEIAEKEHQERIVAAREKYKELLDSINRDGDVDDNLEKLFEALVPSSGKAETVAGEIVRAMMRILYRDYNDGDKFFCGYGLETCGGSAQYLMDKGFESLEEILSQAERYMNNDDAYTAAITDTACEVVDYILDNPDLLGEINDEDSRDYPYDRIEENQPKMDYDFQIPWEVTKYIDAGHIVEDELVDAVESDLSSWGVEYDSVECFSGYIYIYGLNIDDYEQCEEARMYDDSFWSYYIDEWKDEYGDPDDEDEYEDEDEDDDVDESLFDDDEDKAYTYKQVYDELKLETKNFTIESDTIQYGFDSEVEHAVKILNRHYNSVECTGTKITFADRKKKGKKIKEAANPADLTDCPECGDTSFDSKRGRCTKCSYRESLFIKEDVDSFTVRNEFTQSEDSFEDFLNNLKKRDEAAYNVEISGKQIDDNLCDITITGAPDAIKKYKSAHQLEESFSRNIDLDQVVIKVANMLDDRELGDNWIEVFPTRDARPIAGGEYYIPLEITGPNDIKKKATFRTRSGRVEVAFLNGSEAMCDSAEGIARFIAGEFGLTLGNETPFKDLIDKLDAEDHQGLKEEVELDRKNFTSLVKSREGYFVLVDGTYEKRIVADNDEDAIKQFQDYLRKVKL